MASESSGILTELSLSWKYFLTEDEEDLAEEEQFFREDGDAERYIFAQMTKIKIV